MMLTPCCNHHNVSIHPALLPHCSVPSPWLPPCQDCVQKEVLVA